MKRFLALFLALVLFPLAALADLPDISGLSYDDLITLRGQIDLALWSCSEWKSVEVPAGVYRIGTDIPAGHWTLKPPAGESVTIEYFKEADETGKNALNVFENYFSTSVCDESSDLFSIIPYPQTDIDMRDGFYLAIVNGPSVIFEPYVSKSAFSFD